MVFLPSSWAPALPTIPDVPICDFMLDERYGRAPFPDSLPPCICGISGRELSITQLKENVENLARGMATEFGWQLDEKEELRRVVAIFALNTVDIPSLTWAIHRLGGVCAPINAAFTEQELATQLRKVKPKAIFTVAPLLDVARSAAKSCGIDEHRIYICDMPNEPNPRGLTTISALMNTGSSLSTLKRMKWPPGEGKRRIAYLIHSSGTSGLPKVAKISHYNLIANVLQFGLGEERGRGGRFAREVTLGLLPHSHIYGVTYITHLQIYRGDSVVVLPRFDMQQMLSCVAKYKITLLTIVPPIVIAMSKNSGLLKTYDLSSVRSVLSGGAPLAEETINGLLKDHPQWIVRQAYGLTEVAGGAAVTPFPDCLSGSSGCVVPGMEMKIYNSDGIEVTGYDEQGELLIKSPSVILGYLENEEASKEIVYQDADGKWLRSGDIGLFRKSANGNEHLFLVDRIKEMIKVLGNQVVPAELEECLLKHPAVADCAVIGVAHEKAGEAPKAYVQRTADAGTSIPDAELKLALFDFVKNQKARYKWLEGGVVFIEAIPRSPAGKILRRLLRDRKENRLPRL